MLIPQDLQRLLIVTRQETLSQVAHKNTHPHTWLFFFFSLSCSLPAVIFTGQRVNKVAVTILWEPPVTGGGDRHKLPHRKRRSLQGKGLKDQEQPQASLGPPAHPPQHHCHYLPFCTQQPGQRQGKNIRGTHECTQFSVERNQIVKT